jgi:orotate phosphoribosyltransferase
LNAVLRQPEQRELPVRYYEDRRNLAKSLLARSAILTSDSKDPKNPKKPHPQFVAHQEAGHPSPIRINLRADTHPANDGVMPEEDVANAAHCMALLAQGSGFGYHVVAGVPNSGSAYAKKLAWVTMLHCIELEKLSQVGGKHAMGGVHDHLDVPARLEHAVLVNNLLGKGESEIDAIHTLRQMHFKVTHLVVFLDLERGGAQVLEEHNVTVHALFTISEVLDDYVQAGVMTPYRRQKVLQYLLDNS